MNIYIYNYLKEKNKKEWLFESNKIMMKWNLIIDIFWNIKNYIEDTFWHVCYCCQRLCFGDQIYYASQSHIKQFLDCIKFVNFNDKILMCKSYKKHFD